MLRNPHVRFDERGRETGRSRKAHATAPFLDSTVILIHGKSRRDRVQAKLKQIKEALRRRMHRTMAAQGKWLGQVVRGYFNDHAVPTNSRALGAFRHHVVDLWRRTLKRRSQKDDTTWRRMTRLADDWLPKPAILHPWPNIRFAVKHPRWEPYAGIPPVRICAGGRSAMSVPTAIRNAVKPP